MKTQKVVLAMGLFILRLAILILVVVGVYRVGELSYQFCYGIVSNVAVDPEPGKDVSVTVDNSMSAKDTAKLLEKKGLIKDADIFSMQLKMNNYEDKLRAGSYILNTSMTPKDMMRVMSGEQLETEEEE